MAAHLRSIEKQCIKCGKRATVQLLSTWNDEMGVYCQTCGTEALHVLWDAAIIQRPRGYVPRVKVGR